MQKLYLMEGNRPDGGTDEPTMENEVESVDDSLEYQEDTLEILLHAMAGSSNHAHEGNPRPSSIHDSHRLRHHS